jgi:hypothetical protein
MHQHQQMQSSNAAANVAAMSSLILIAHNAAHRGRGGEGQGGPAAAGPGYVALVH